MTEHTTIDTPNARLLYRVMSDLSEDYFCAGWLSDCEFALWASLTGKTAAGVEAWRLSEDEVAELRLAQEIAGGWVVWSREQRGPIFLSNSEWAAYLEARSATTD